MARLLDTYRRRLSPTSDYWLLGAVLALTGFGLMMIMSASVIVSYERFNSNYVYVGRQAMWFALALIALLVTANLDYRIWRKNATVLMIVGLILLAAIFIPGVGVRLGGAHRWIGFGAFTVQPSEIIKLVFIIYLAAWLEARQTHRERLRHALVPFFTLMGLVGFLILKQPDFGTFLVIAAVSVAIFFVSGASAAQLGGALLSGFLIFLLLVKSASYRWARFLTFLNPRADVLGAGYQINQALLAIGTGGLFGLGFGQSRQKYLYLPQPHIDSIFAVMVEELGFLRVAVVLLVYVFLIARGLRVASQAPDGFGRLVAVGVTFWIFFQAFVNIGAISGLLPLTGVPLPFISFGGSSLVMLFAGAGILLNISKQTAR